MSERERHKAEEGRVEAEEGRVEAEVERVEAEIGPELGRVHAEEDRASEEEDRQAAARSRRQAEEARVEAETRREVAEAERMAHEINRRVAEGGPDQHVPAEYGPSPPGRWEREQDRVKADKTRPTYGKITTLIAIPLAFIFLAPAVVGLIYSFKNNQQLADQNERLADQALANCHEIEEIKSNQRKEARDDKKLLSDAAREDRARLLANLKLLKLEPTREITVEANRSLRKKLSIYEAEKNTNLRLYKAESCPRDLP